VSEYNEGVEELQNILRFLPFLLALAELFGVLWLSCATT
jgi:hypothetical protein